MSEDLYIRQCFTSRLVCDRRYLSDGLLALFRDPDIYLEDVNTTELQDNFKSRVGIVEIDGRKIVVKRHNYKSRWQQIKRYFRRTKSSRSWYYSRLLQRHNILIPRPVAYYEKRIGPLRGLSYFCYEFVEGVAGEVYLEQQAHSPEKIKAAVDKILELVEKIEGLGLIHGDIRLANLIFYDDLLYLIDFDDVRPRSWFKPPIMKDRDIRGLRKDVCLHVPEPLQQFFLEKIEEKYPSHARGCLSVLKR